MLQNLLAAALRNLVRNKVTATINILGLALGVAATLFIAIFAYDELNYDRFLDGYENIYRVSSSSSIPGQAPIITDTTSPDTLALIRSRFQSVEAIGRLVSRGHMLRKGEVEAAERVYWADPEILKVLKLPAVAGNVEQALETPDSIVITRNIARKYFGTDTPVGESLELDRNRSLRVTAVLEDLPPNTHLDTEIIASGRSAGSEIARLDAIPPSPSKPWLAFTYLKLREGAAARDIKQQLDEAAANAAPGNGKGPRLEYHLLRVDRIHLHNIGKMGPKMKPDGSANTVYAMSIVGALVLLAACLNFVNLMTAQAAQRACEVGVRKAAGASRTQLITQFIGEMTVYAAVSTLVALALVKLLFVPYETFIGRPIAWSFWTDPLFLATVVLMVLAIGVLAGAYPALLLSAFQPIVVLKGSASQSASAGPTRRALVIAQFGICMGLTIATLIIYRQTQFAMTEGLRLDKDQVLVLNGPCVPPFLEQVRALGGVRSAACSMQAPFTNGVSRIARNREGTEFQLFQSAIDADFFEVYGLTPLAGRFFSRDRVGDTVDPKSATPGAAPLVLNETAARRFAFNPPSSAVGQSVRWHRLVSMGGEFAPEAAAQIIGVVPDFPMGTIEKTVDPTVYFVDNTMAQRISLKLVGQQIPETLNAIDGLWKTLGPPRAIDRFFLSDYVERLYTSVTRTANVLTLFAALALSVACLGLVGLASYAAISRSREIGVRKAAGASREQILWLLLRQFSAPVLWASLLAWPVSFYFMRQWLEKFAYRIDLDLWPFLLISLITLGVAWVTVTPQAWRMAVASPSRSLREE